jgi:hypothetical protein
VRCVLKLLIVFSLMLSLSGCRHNRDTSSIGTFRMGEKVQAGPLVYTVLNASWKPIIEGSSRTPNHRYLFLQVSISNVSNKRIAASSFTLQGPTGSEYHELTEGVAGVQDWLNALRNIEPTKTETGYVVFDAPVSAYKLVVTDMTDSGDERYAYVDIPVDLD